MRIVDAVDLHQILQKHKDNIRKEARLLAEVGVLEQVEDLRRETFEVFVVLQNLQHAQLLHLFSKALARFDQNVGLGARIHVVLEVDAVLARDVHEHLDVVFVVGILLLVGVQQVLVLLEVANHFSVDSLVLQRAVQNDKHFRRDGPIVQVGDVAFQDELESANRTDLVFVLSMQAFK